MRRCAFPSSLPHGLVLLVSLSLILLAAFSTLGVSHAASPLCTKLKKYDYVAEMYLYKGKFLVPLFRLGNGSRVLNVYVLLDINSTQKGESYGLRVTSIKRLGDNIYINAMIYGRDIYFYTYYYINKDIEFYISALNRTWMNLTIVMSDLRSSLGPVQGSATLGGQAVTPWIKMLRETFLVNMVNNQAYLYNDGRYMPVGVLPFFNNYMISPILYAETLINRSIGLLENLYNNPAALNKIVNQVLSATNKTQQSAIIGSIVDKLYASTRPSFSYMGLRCVLSVTATFISATCKPPYPMTMRVLSINKDMLSTSPETRNEVIKALENNDLEELQSLLSQAIQVKELNVSKLYGGVLTLLALRGIIPKSSRDINVLALPYYSGGSKALLFLLRTPPFMGKPKSIKEFIEKELGKMAGSVSGNITYRYYAANSTLVVNMGNNNVVTIQFWPRDINGTDSICVIPGTNGLAKIINESMQSWRQGIDGLNRLINDVRNKIWEFIVVASTKGTGSPKLLEIIDSLKSMRTSMGSYFPLLERISLASILAEASNPGRQATPAHSTSETTTKTKTGKTPSLTETRPSTSSKTVPAASTLSPSPAKPTSRGGETPLSPRRTALVVLVSLVIVIVLFFALRGRGGR